MVCNLTSKGPFRILLDNKASGMTPGLIGLSNKYQSNFANENWL